MSHHSESTTTHSHSSSSQQRETIENGTTSPASISSALQSLTTSFDSPPQVSGQKRQRSEEDVGIAHDDCSPGSAPLQETKASQRPKLDDVSGANVAHGIEGSSGHGLPQVAESSSSSDPQLPPHPSPQITAAPGSTLTTDPHTLGTPSVESITATAAILPPRVRRPPVSQSAWSALRDRIGGPSLSSPSPFSPTPPPASHHSDNDRTSSVASDRPAIGRLQAIHPFSRFRHPAMNPSTSAAQMRPIASLPSSTSHHRWGPGAVIAALMSDILGLSSRGSLSPPGGEAVGPAAAPRPAPPLPLPSHIRPLVNGLTPPPSSHRHPHQRGQATVRPGPQQADSAPTQRPGPLPPGTLAPPADGLRLFPLGGTSIIVQGAMIARLSNTEAERASSNDNQQAAESRDIQQEPEVDDETVEESSSAPSSLRPQELPPAGRHQGNRADGHQESSADGIPAWGEAQASMLTRLLSVAAAATAASLTTSPPHRPVGVPQIAGQVAGIPHSHRPGPFSSSLSSSASDSAEPQRQSGSHRSPAISRVPERGQYGFGSNGRLRQSLASFTTLLRHRLRPSAVHEEASPMVTTSQSDTRDDPESVPVSYDAVDAEAMEVDSALGPGSLHTHVTASDEQPVSDRTTEIHEGGGSSLQDNRPVLSMSEMLQEAIREGPIVNPSQNPSHTADPIEAPLSPDADAEDARQPPAHPTPEYIRGVLHAVRSNSLRRGLDGTFERWLFNLGADLEHALRSMAALHTASLMPNRPSDHAGRSASETEGNNVDAEQPAQETEDALRRRALDVDAGQLSFFRLFRLDGQETQETSGTGTPSGIPTMPQGGVGSNMTNLVPCVVVGVRSLPLATDSVTPQSAMDRFRNLLSAVHPTRQTSQDRSVLTQNDAIGPTAVGGQRIGGDDSNHVRARANNSEMAGQESSPASGSAVAHPPSDQPDTSRFLLFVSGGHYPPTHPLLSTPSHVAARDLMVLIEVLSNLDAASASAAGVNGRVSEEDLEAYGPRIKTWWEVKKGVVEVDAAEGTTTNEGGSDATLAVRAGDRCAICLEEWSDEDAVRILGCRHTYHQGCVDQWVLKRSNSCPMCRQVAVKKETDADEIRSSDHAAEAAVEN